MDGGSDLAEQPNPDALGATIVGTTVGNYEVLDEIGRGGMGVVYLARQRGLERQVALKALHGATGLARGAGEALVKESRLAGSLSHANIVTVHEYLEEAGTPYIAMEYVPRGSLRPWMGHMSVAQLAGVLEDLLAGLAAVAPSGIVHRDLKPENVMVTADGHVKIADFGIAKATQQIGGVGVTSTPTGVTIGTPAYMAPEQALCEEVGPWTDLYSIGVIAYEHLVGHLPFHDAGTAMAMLLCHVRDPVPDPVDVDDRIDRALSGWVGRLLIKDPARRTQDPAVASDELEEIAIGLMGAKWRRECRLSERQRKRIALTPLEAGEFVSQKVTVQTTPSTDPVFLTAPIATVRVAEPPAGRRRDQTGATPVHRGRVAAVGMSLAAVAAVLGGFAVARAADPGGGKSSSRATAGTVSTSLPSGWRQAPAAATVPGYHFNSPIVARSADRASTATITLGTTNSASAALLPVGSFASGHAAPRREAVTLNGRAFFRYLTSSIDSTGPAAVYTQPTSAGVLVAVCQLPTADHARSVNHGCEQILETSEVSGARALPLAQSATYATSLTGTIRNFDHERSTLTTQLTSAPSAPTQSSAALRLRHANLRTARSLRSLSPGPSEASYNATLADAAERMASGYGEMATAAQGEHAARFRQGAGVVRNAWVSMRKTLNDFATSG